MEVYRVNSPQKVVGDKQTTANLRYKHGRNLNYEAKDVLHLEIRGRRACRCQT